MEKDIVRTTISIWLILKLKLFVDLMIFGSNLYTRKL
jgi:hypothetical protein